MEPCDSDKSGQRTSTPPKEQSNSTALDSKKLPTESPVSVNPSQSPATTNAASGRLVYVRRRVEVDSSKHATKPKDILVSSSTAAPPPAAESSPQEATTHRLDWEERYHHLQMLLNKLNESDHTDHHLQMLWSLSSAELSKHAVDLEKRSIQFSLEEAREMQRVAALNVLGRSVNSLKSTSNDGEKVGVSSEGKNTKESSSDVKKALLRCLWYHQE